VYGSHGNRYRSQRRRHRRRCRGGGEIRVEADEASKSGAEFGTEERVEDEVDRTVDGHEQVEHVARYRQQVSPLRHNIIKARSQHTN